MTRGDLTSQNITENIRQFNTPNKTLDVLDLAISIDNETDH